MSSQERSISSKEDDLFHSITMAEQSTWEKGYAEGVERGKKKGFEDGWKLGTQKGTELGKEVGFYAGYATYVLNTRKDESTTTRINRLCQSILELGVSFRSLDPTDEALTDSLGRLQAKFKQLTSLLGVRLEFKTATSSTGISF